MTAPPAVMEGSGDPGELVRTRRQASAEELILPEGSGMSSGQGSGLGSGIILGESGSGIDGMDPSKMEVEEEMSVVDTKNTLLQAENVLPVTSKSYTIIYPTETNHSKFTLHVTVKPSTKKETTTSKPSKKPGVEVIENDKVKADAAASKKGKEDSTRVDTAKPGRSKAKSPFSGKKKKMKVCKVVAPPKPKCDATEYGCCPDGTSPAKGPFEAGMFVLKLFD